MSHDEQLVERIVANVMSQFVTGRDPVRTSGPDFHANRVADVGQDNNTQHATGAAIRKEQTLQSECDSLNLPDHVITGELLESRLNGHGRLVVGSRSILTPLARDVLRARKIECVRATAERAVQEDGATWLAVRVTASPVVESVVDHLAESAEVCWRSELAGQPAEAVELAVAALCRAEAVGAAVFVEQAELAACLANRNPRVRAAVVNDAAAMDAVRETMGANLIAVNPRAKTFFELRQLLKGLTLYPVPRSPGLMKM